MASWQGCTRWDRRGWLLTLTDHALLRQDRAFVQTEKYKEGKFILEKNIMVDVR